MASKTQKAAQTQNHVAATMTQDQVDEKRAELGLSGDAQPTILPVVDDSATQAAELEAAKAAEQAKEQAFLAYCRAFGLDPEVARLAQKAAVEQQAKQERETLVKAATEGVQKANQGKVSTQYFDTVKCEEYVVLVKKAAGTMTAPVVSVLSLSEATEYLLALKRNVAQAQRASANPTKPAEQVEKERSKAPKAAGKEAPALVKPLVDLVALKAAGDRDALDGARAELAPFAEGVKAPAKYATVDVRRYRVTNLAGETQEGTHDDLREWSGIKGKHDIWLPMLVAMGWDVRRIA